MKSLATNQTLTTTFTDIGSIIGPSTLANTTGDVLSNFSFITVAVEIDINDSTGFEIQALFIDTIDGKEFDFPLETIKQSSVDVEPLVQQLKNDVDSNQGFGWVINNTVEALQFQVRVDTDTGIAGVVTSIRYNLGYNF